MNTSYPGSVKVLIPKPTRLCHHCRLNVRLDLNRLAKFDPGAENSWEEKRTSSTVCVYDSGKTHLGEDDMLSSRQLQCAVEVTNATPVKTLKGKPPFVILTVSFLVSYTLYSGPLHSFSSSMSITSTTKSSTDEIQVSVELPFNQLRKKANRSAMKTRLFTTGHTGGDSLA